MDEKPEEMRKRLSGTHLLAYLVFLIAGVVIIIDRRFSRGFHSLGTYLEISGAQAVAAGIALLAWSMFGLWFTYLRRAWKAGLLSLRGVAGFAVVTAIMIMVREVIGSAGGPRAVRVAALVSWPIVMLGGGWFFHAWMVSRAERMGGSPRSTD